MACKAGTQAEETAVPEVSAEVFAIGRSERGDLSAVLGGRVSRKHPGSRHFAALDRRRWQLLRLRIFERDNWRCRKCGRAGRLECDHIVPLQRCNDSYRPSNLQSLCRGCHIEKTRTDIGNVPDPEREAWRALVAELSIDVSSCS